MSTKEALQDKRIQEVIEGNGRGSVTAYAKWESGRVTKQVIGVAEGVVDKAPFIFSPVDVKPEDLQGKHIDWEKNVITKVTGQEQAVPRTRFAAATEIARRFIPTIRKGSK